jgi:hypothetical protein
MRNGPCIPCTVSRSQSARLGARLVLATRLGLQTGQARLGAVAGARLVLATRLGLQTGQARLGAVRAFLGARQTVQRHSSVTLSRNPTEVRRPPTGFCPVRCPRFKARDVAPPTLRSCLTTRQGIQDPDGLAPSGESGSQATNPLRR